MTFGHGEDGVMAALHSLLAIFGAIDQMVLDDPEGGADVASRYLPAYAERGAAGWFQEVVALANEQRVEGVVSVAFPELPEALETFVDSDVAASAPQLARLVLAVAMIQRLDPEQHYAEREMLVAALGSVTPRTGDRDTAEALFDFLGSDEAFPDQAAWSEMVARAVEQGLLSESLAVVPAPCTGGYTIVRVGGVPQVVPRLETDFTNPNATMDDVRAVLDPLNWHRCCPYFCSMTPLPPDVHGWSQVLEELSDRCPPIWNLLTGLRYWRADLSGGGAAVNYDLCLERPAADDGLVLVDRGTVVAVPVPTGGVRIRTTKEILFVGIASPAISLFACTAGWADVGYDMLFGCTPEGAEWQPWTASEPPPVTPRSGEPRPRPNVEPTTSNAVVDETVDWLTTCIDDLSTKSGAYLQRAAEGKLTIDDMVRFTADLGTRMLTDPFRAVDIATRAARARVDQTSGSPDEESTGEAADASSKMEP
jgi:hypothetical protein